MQLLLFRTQSTLRDNTSFQTWWDQLWTIYCSIININLFILVWLEVRAQLISLFLIGETPIHQIFLETGTWISHFREKFINTEEQRTFSIELLNQMESMKDWLILILIKKRQHHLLLIIVTFQMIESNSWKMKLIPKSWYLSKLQPAGQMSWLNLS